VVGLNNVDKVKMEVLRRRSQETYNDVNWLRSIRDKFRVGV
jgi:hypothetical protein